MKRQIVEKQLTISGDLSRREIRRIVITKFLEEEPGSNSKVKYHYHVETLKDGRRMFLQRPTFRFDFDFKVEVENLVIRGTHKEILEDFKKKRKENPEGFAQLLQAVRRVHAGGDIESASNLVDNLKFQTGLTLELLLKLLKWMFILEDIYYWNYEGRNKLMDFIAEELG